jgi:fructuronate reductase
MVDRIVPATTAADRAGVAALLGGLADEAAVMTEGFSQWVIKDRFAGPRPRWELVGAQLVSDVAPYETAKLRMLNGAHSALAYCGLERGHEFVHQAVADPPLRALIDRLMRQEAAPTIAAAPGQDLDAYADALLARFANAALRHQLAQIAMDGSQKIPQRWLATLAASGQQGRRCPAILVALAAWLRHVRGAGHVVNDPLANALRSAWASEGAAGIVDALFARRGLIGGPWRPSPAQHAWLTEAVTDPLLPPTSSESRLLP